MLRKYTVSSFAILLSFSISSVHALKLEDMLKKKELDSTLVNKKIGYYIGSFDPLHVGHEALVKEILDQNLCDYILIYPEWEEENKKRTDVKIRLEMLSKVYGDHPKVIVTSLNSYELQNTLMQEKKDHLIEGKALVTSAFKGTEYIGIIGSYTALELAKDQKKDTFFMKGIKLSENYKEVPLSEEKAIPVERFIVALQGEDSLDTLKGKINERVIMKVVKTKKSDISSPKIRSILSFGDPVEPLVNPEVLKIIASYNLYQK